MPRNSSHTLETLERLAPGTQLRRGLERILQQGNGALIVLGGGRDLEQVSSGGFRLQKAGFTPARLSELAKMDGGIIIDRAADAIIAANVHFVPDSSIPSDETGARHRTAQRIAIQTGCPVVAVSEGRRVATLYIDDQKIELVSPTELTARVNQELQVLDRLRRQLDEAETLLTNLEVAGLASYRAVVTVIQRAELVRRVGLAIEREAVSLGDEGRLATMQLADMVHGVEQVRDLILRDYLPRRGNDVGAAAGKLEGLSDTDLVDPVKVGKAAGFAELDEPAEPRGLRILSRAGRIPEPVREETARHFGTIHRLMEADTEQLERVEGIGETRARQLRQYLDRLKSAADAWTPQGL